MYQSLFVAVIKHLDQTDLSFMVPDGGCAAVRGAQCGTLNQELKGGLSTLWKQRE